MPIETNNLYNNYYKEAIKTLTPPVTPKNNKPETENKTEDINPIIKDEFNKQKAQKPPINNATIVYPTPLMEKVNVFTSIANVVLFAGFIALIAKSMGIFKKDFVRILTKYTPDKGFDLDSLLGMSQFKKEIRTKVIEPFRASAKNTKKYTLRVPQGIILHGPPGNGKSYSVKAIAGELNADVYYMSCSNILSKYVGDSEKAIKGAFVGLRQLAQKQDRPVILCLEEADALLAARETGGENHAINMKFLSTMLQELEVEAKNFLTILTTNDVKALDKAAKRPGRASLKIEVPNPSKSDYKTFLKGFISKNEVITDEILKDEEALDKLAKEIYNSNSNNKEEAFCIKDIEEIVDSAFVVAYSKKANQLTVEHIKTAILDYKSMKAAELGRKSNTMGFGTQSMI